MTTYYDDNDFDATSVRIAIAQAEQEGHKNVRVLVVALD